MQNFSHLVQGEHLSTCSTIVLSRKCIAPTLFKQASLLQHHLKISGQSCPLKFKWLAKMMQTQTMTKLLS